MFVELYITMLRMSALHRRVKLSIVTLIFYSTAAFSRYASTCVEPFYYLTPHSWSCTLLCDRSMVRIRETRCLLFLCSFWYCRRLNICLHVCGAFFRYHTIQWPNRSDLDERERKNNIIFLFCRWRQPLIWSPSPIKKTTLLSQPFVRSSWHPLYSCSELEDGMIVPSEDHMHNLNMIQKMFGNLQVSESAFQHPERILIIGLGFLNFLV